MTATADDAGKELDRQGHAVEPGADLGRGHRVRCDLGPVTEARSVIRISASEPGGNGARRTIRSPRIPSRSRLVARIRTRGQARSRLSTKAAAAWTTCPQLSTTRNLPSHVKGRRAWPVLVAH
jgi:hypothetical protein